MLTQDTDLTNKFLNKFEHDAQNEADRFMGDLENEVQGDQRTQEDKRLHVFGLQLFSSCKKLKI